MRVGAASCVGLDEPDRVVHPGSWPVADGRLRHRNAAVEGDRCDSAEKSGPPVGAATNVSSVASGRQQNRTGWNGDVPIPADTCNCMFAPQLDGPLARERSRPPLVTSAP